MNTYPTWIPCSYGWTKSVPTITIPANTISDRTTNVTSPTVKPEPATSRPDRIIPRPCLMLSPLLALRGCVRYDALGLDPTPDRLGRSVLENPSVVSPNHLPGT